MILSFLLFISQSLQVRFVLRDKSGEYPHYRKCDYNKIECLLGGNLVDNALLGKHSRDFRRCHRPCKRDPCDLLVTEELTLCNGVCPLSPIADRNRFILFFSSYICRKLNYFLKENRINFCVIKLYLEIVYDHFICKKNNVNELAIFMANSFYNTSFLKIFLLDVEINQQRRPDLGVNFCRGVLQIYGCNYYRIADNNSEGIRFSLHPEKMAYLSRGALTGTISFWEYMVCEIKKQHKCVTYDSVLKFLNPLEVQGNNRCLPEYEVKLRHRKRIYNEILVILNFYG